jgi:hypothetical protein
LVQRATGSLWFYRLIYGRRTFTFKQRRYRYFFARYNATWKTERAVEVPIVWEHVRRYSPEQVLEIGNVLSHYFPVRHDIVDKYEAAPGVHNVDIVDYVPARRYDLIVSISTLEHVGWDETPREPAKLHQAIERIRHLLTPTGLAVITLPLAYNQAMDAMLRERALAITELGCLKRISADNRWVETTWPEIATAEFDQPFRGINGLLLATVTHQAAPIIDR